MASKRRIRNKACGKKQRYASKHVALTSLKYVPGGNEMNCYKCKFCNGWHLDHMPKSIVARRQNG